METHEIKMLREEMQSLRSKIDGLSAQINDLMKAQEIDRDESIKLISLTQKDFCQDIVDIYDYLWPVFHKAFPDYAKTQKSIDDILSRHRGQTTDDKKKS